MTTPTVTLIGSGSFEIKSQHLGAYDYRASFEPEEECHPWQVTQKSPGGDTWKFASSFATLDEALDWSVSSATGEFPVQPYGVSLPCGQYFSRPGRIPAEEVMSGMGWSYVHYVSGSSAKDFHVDATRAEAEAYFEELAELTIVAVGDVTRCLPDVDDKPGKSLWIGEMMVPINNFVRIDTIAETALALFEEEGVPVLEHVEYFQLLNPPTAHCATILSFPVAVAADEDAPASRAGAEARG